MEIDLLKLNYTDQIDIDTDVDYSDEYISGSGIIHLNNVHVSGTIKTDIEYNYDVLLDLSGEMIIIDSLSSEEVPYKFNTNIEEKLENSLKSLDLIAFLWQYIVMEIPMRFTMHDELSIKKDDYEVISEEEYKEKKNNPFKDFHLE